MRIDLKKLIQELDLDKSTLAQVLFPTNSHPSQALARLLQRNVSLKEKQIYRLSMFTGLSIDSLYEDSLLWKMETLEETLKFTRGDYTAIYYPNTGFTKVYELNSPLAVKIVSVRTESLSEYLADVDEVIHINRIRV